MYISLILALAAPLSSGMVDAPQQRGLVSTVSASADAAVGTYHFTMRGSNPCGAVRLDYGDGTDAAAKRLDRVLTSDPGMGVVRHADAGYDLAVATALPFLMMVYEVTPVLSVEAVHDSSICFSF